MSSPVPGSPALSVLSPSMDMGVKTRQGKIRQVGWWVGGVKGNIKAKIETQSFPFLIPIVLPTVRTNPSVVKCTVVCVVHSTPANMNDIDKPPRANDPDNWPASHSGRGSAGAV